MAFKFCPECGFKLDKEYKFCPECGFRLQSNTASNKTAIKDIPVKQKKNLFDDDFSLLESSFDNQINSKNDKNDEYNKKIALARSYSIRKRVDEALEIYNELLNEDIDDINPYVGIIRAKTNNYSKITKEADKDIVLAMELFGIDKILKADPDYQKYLDLIKETKEKEEAKNEEERIEKLEKKAESNSSCSFYVDYLKNNEISFGVYPQSLKKKDVKILCVSKRHPEFYLGDDAYLYKKYDENYYKIEPIKWGLYKDKYKKEEDVLYISNSILDYWEYRRFYPSAPKEAWQYDKSNLRIFLTVDFANKAFGYKNFNFAKPTTSSVHEHRFSQTKGANYLYDDNVIKYYSDKYYDDSVYVPNLANVFMAERWKLSKADKKITDYAKARYKHLYLEKHKVEAKTVPPIYWTGNPYPKDPLQMVVINSKKNIIAQEYQTLSTNELAGIVPVICIKEKNEFD